MSVSDLPPLANEGPIVSPFEFMPAWRFYLPLYPHIAKLAIKHGGLTSLMSANPAIPGGGLVGESKSQVMDLVSGPSRALIAPYIKCCRSPGEAPLDALVAKMEECGIHFPVVAKPDISCRGAGIRKINSAGDLAAYWDSFPEGADFLLQTLVNAEPEAGLFYVRDPGENVPRIFSFTLKYTPAVMGDGVSTLRQLIEQDSRAQLALETYLAKPDLDLSHVPASGARMKLAFAGNHCRGSVFRNGAEFVTPKLTAAVDEIARSMPDFNFGRLDVRFESLAELGQGRGFRIIEINGVGSEATHIWDNRFELSHARATLQEQFRLAYEIGAKMRQRGAKPIGLGKLISMWLRERRLTARYPVSH